MDLKQSVHSPSRALRFAMLGLLAFSLAACGSGGSGEPIKPETDPGPKTETNVDGIITPLPTLEVQPEEVRASSLPAIGPNQTRSSDGLWLEPQPWPVISIHATLLPPKNLGPSSVLTWGWNSPYLKANEGITFVDEYTPSTGSHTPTQMKSGTNGDMFGNGHAFTEEGDLFMAGGSQPYNALGHWVAMNDVFKRTSGGTWSILPKMSLERWYPTVTLLPNGEMLVSSGIKVQSEGANIPLSEIYQKDGKWRSLTGATDKFPALYPWLHVMPDGRVFNSGPQREMAILETNGAGSWTNIKKERDDTNRGYGSSVMFTEGKVLVMGGGYASQTTTIVDVRTGSSTPTGSMHFGRRNLNAMVLPDGDVLVIGGNAGGGNSDGDPAYPAELWNATTGEWTVLSSQSQIRNYHSTALLLPSGAIISTGGFNTPGEKTAEMFLPPYLFNPNGSLRTLENGTRPLAYTTKHEITYGEKFTVYLKSAKSIKMLSLLSPGSTTHAFDMSQRRLELKFVKASANTLTVTAPENVNLALRGNYMLFAVDSDGVPSSAQWLKLK
jgi:galactose oxidase